MQHKPERLRKLILATVRCLPSWSEVDMWMMRPWCPLAGSWVEEALAGCGWVEKGLVGCCWVEEALVGCCLSWFSSKQPSCAKSSIDLTWTCKGKTILINHNSTRLLSWVGCKSKSSSKCNILSAAIWVYKYLLLYKCEQNSCLYMIFCHEERIDSVGLTLFNFCNSCIWYSLVCIAFSSWFWSQNKKGKGDWSTYCSRQKYLPTLQKEARLKRRSHVEGDSWLCFFKSNPWLC